MARETWGERFSNAEKVLFQKGLWALTEDNEKIWSLYFNGECVNPVLDCNSYVLFDKGFLLKNERGVINKYYLFYEDEKKPIYEISGVSANVEIDDSFITFKKVSEETTFNKLTLTELFFDKDNQIGMSF